MNRESRERNRDLLNAVAFAVQLQRVSSQASYRATKQNETQRNQDEIVLGVDRPWLSLSRPVPRGCPASADRGGNRGNRSHLALGVVRRPRARRRRPRPPPAASTAARIGLIDEPRLSFAAHTIGAERLAAAIACLSRRDRPADAYLLTPFFIFRVNRLESAQRDRLMLNDRFFRPRQLSTEPPGRMHPAQARPV